MDHPLGDACRDSRRMLGFGDDVTVVATGHQAAIWHPGILPKALADRALVESLAAGGGTVLPLNFFAAQDANDGGLVAYPTMDLRRGGWRMLPPTDRSSTIDRPTARPAAVPGDSFDREEIRRGLESIHAAVERHRDAPNLATQLAGAAASLAAPWSGEIPRASMSGLLHLPIGRQLLERMERAPETCIAAHDAAVEEDRFRRSASRRRTRGAARLLGREAAPELPLWRNDGDGRRPVLVGEPIDPETCRPRALLATALARLAGCDLFVHGLGGEIYDVVMESWVERWLGPEVASGLAPATIATATCLLPIADDLPAADPGISPEGLHRLESDPDLARSGSRLRAGLLAEIDAAPRRSPARRAAFLRLRAEIADARVRGADEIEAYRGRLERESEGRRHRAVAEDRTWPFPLHPSASLDDLLQGCRTAFAPVADEAQASPNGRGR
ncbi:MAG: hypothetical protein VXX86_10105 [Planctomycetota bacterium]|nr:hypothetical protein [Planctomycetota bacterium]